MDDHPSRTRTEPARGASGASPAPLAHLTPSEPSSGSKAGSRICVVCGKKFTARRPEARACGGRCRMNASRGRRVAELVALIEASETRIEQGERALADARAALGALRELASLGASKVMP